MAQRRISELSFNFDSLTDLVTNLAGALIMIVLLFFGLSAKGVQQTVRQAVDRTAQKAKAAPKAPSKAPVLRIETAVVEARLKNRRDVLEKLRADIAEIDRTAVTMQPREFADPEGKPGTAARVEFRPPMVTKKDELSTGAFVVVSRNRVFLLGLADFRAKLAEIRQEMVKAYEQASDKKGFEFTADRTLASGDFDMHYTASEITKTSRTLRKQNKIEYTYSYKYKSNIIKKSSAVGETEAEALEPGSSFRAQIDQLDPDKETFSFSVYPDSFELFRKLRAETLKPGRSFRYNWGPVPAGIDVSIGSGGGVQ
jgi:hypothetical protein